MEQMYRQMILSWREAYERLTEEERANVTNLDDFRAPCQLEVVSLGNDQLGIHEVLLIVSHFEDEPDLTVIVHAPVVSTEGAAKFLEISNSTRFERPLPEKIRFLGAKTYRDLIESHLLRLVESFRNIAMQTVWSGQVERQGRPYIKQMMSEEAFVWQLQGTLNQKAIDSIVNDMMTQAKMQTERKQQTPAKEGPPKPVEATARGTYIYPYVWVGSRPSHSFHNDLTDRMYGRQRLELGYGEKVLFEKFGHFYALATQNGFVAVSVEDIADALRLLNLFMSLLILRGIPALAVRENELAELSIDLNKGKIGRSSAAIVLPRMLRQDPSFVLPKWQEETMPVLEAKMVQQIWKDVQRILRDTTSADLLQIFAEVYTHYQSAEYTPAVLLAWTFIERWYDDIREKSLGARDSKRPPTLTAFVRFLEKEARPDTESIAKLYQMQRLRSEVLHSSRQVTKQEAQDALTTITGILQSKGTQLP